LNIPDDKEEDFDDNINFYVLCLHLGGTTVYEIVKIESGKRRRFINNIFQSPSRESSFPISYFVGLVSIMPIVISDFYTIINLYTIRHTVVKSVDNKTI
jgi:hypothetical protein